METNHINLFVFDKTDNYEKSKHFLGAEGSTFKRMICVQNAQEFEDKFAEIPNDEHVFMVVHVFYTDKISGLKSFVASRLSAKYAKLGFMYISDGDDKKIRHDMIEADIKDEKIYKYHQVLSNLENGIYKTNTKNDVINKSAPLIQVPASLHPAPSADYVIITALEEDEMEKVIENLIVDGKVPHKKHLIEYGHYPSKPNKTIAYASQLSTGMIDAAILATQMIDIFHPKYLIMAGVLGGRPEEVEIGDIIVATKMFTIDKGKLQDGGFKKESEQSSTDHSAVSGIRRKKDDICTFLKKSDSTRKRAPNMHFGPIACVRYVVDKKGFFDSAIVPEDRKALALEMEGYGVARAVELAGDGQTMALIIKSVMDNTVDKVDEAKHYAAWTSANAVKYMIENDII